MNTFERFWCCWLFLRAIKTNKNSVFKGIHSFIIQLIKVSSLFWPFLVFLQSFLAVPAGQAIECIFSLPFEASGSAVQWLHQRRCELWKKNVQSRFSRTEYKSAITYLFLILFLMSPGTGTQRSLSQPLQRARWWTASPFPDCWVDARHKCECKRCRQHFNEKMSHCRCPVLSAPVCKSA